MSVSKSHLLDPTPALRASPPRQTGGKVLADRRMSRLVK